MVRNELNEGGRASGAELYLRFRKNGASHGCGHYMSLVAPAILDTLETMSKSGSEPIHSCPLVFIRGQTAMPLGRGPNSAVPMRIKVAPSSMATSKSALMPMLK